MPLAATKSKLDFFQYKHHSQGHMVIELVSFERVSLVEYACQISSLYLLWFKVMPKVNFFFATDRQTGQKLDDQGA